MGSDATAHSGTGEIAPSSSYPEVEDMPTSRLVRGGRIGRFAARQAVRNAQARFARFANGTDAEARATTDAFARGAEELVDILGTMKGPAMKVGQMLSVIDVQIIPAEHRDRFRAKLAALRDRAPAVPFERMRHVVEEDLGGRPLDAVFAEFDPTPIAAASIGQVYRARLIDGREVAVKVQYPGIGVAVRADLKNLALVLRMAKPLLPTFDSTALLGELQLHLDHELDYLREADTQHEQAKRYADHPFVHVPDAVVELCGPRVLVTEYVAGTRFDEICAMPAEVRDRVGESIFRFYVGSIYRDHRFNGDPHPGNVMLGADGRVVFLDFGLFKHMRSASVEVEREALSAAIEGRADALLAAMRRSGAIRPAATITAEDLLAYVYDASPWTFVDEMLAMTTELAGGAVMLIADPRSPNFEHMRREDLPPEHFFSRRADFYTFGMLGQLAATANWHRIGREWICGDAPSTVIGEAEQAWRLLTD